MGATLRLLVLPFADTNESDGDDGRKNEEFLSFESYGNARERVCFYRRRLFELASDIVDSNEVQYLGAGW